MTNQIIFSGSFLQDNIQYYISDDHATKMNWLDDAAVATDNTTEVFDEMIAVCEGLIVDYVQVEMEMTAKNPELICEYLGDIEYHNTQIEELNEKIADLENDIADLDPTSETYDEDVADLNEWIFNAGKDVNYAQWQVEALYDEINSIEGLLIEIEDGIASLTSFRSKCFDAKDNAIQNQI